MLCYVFWSQVECGIFCFICIFFSIGPEGFLQVHPKDSSFKLKSPTNMTSVERLLMD